MGASASSRQRMGERVTAGRRKLEHALALQQKRVKAIESSSPQTLSVMVDAVAASFGAMAPFLEGTLLAAFKANPKRIEEAVMASCNKVRIMREIRPQSHTPNHLGRCCLPRSRRTSLDGS